ncbi:MAG: transcriptional regulator NrdR [Candidatus Aenigmatarchaeota archaeon]
MKCPYCGTDENRVTDKRETEDFQVTRRRRECLKCNKRFTTYERMETLDFTIVKKDGSREQYDRNKLLAGVLHACEKRPIPRSSIEEMINKIEADLKVKNTKEINSSHVGESVIKELQQLDNVAYIRFASVYREFTDLESFEKELTKLKKIQVK